MITGKMNKFIQEITLLGQSFVKDPDVKISKLLKDNNAEVLQYIRFEVGEGIEKAADNFVEEVMAQAKG
ncbi:Translation elongation factor Ts [hydrothermal vent metagenome]|uniref:Translation elongation factor Ts n=1 Tax=hydrothermal vent metagenome TaxID=652676 RepID=A0A1W1C1L3_9ZZZZ